MAPQHKSKRTKQHNDDEVILALRAAVLARIGKTKEGMSVIKKIESEGISPELKKIGERLTRHRVVPKQRKRKNQGISALTTKEIEYIKKISGIQNRKTTQKRRTKKRSTRHMRKPMTHSTPEVLDVSHELTGGMAMPRRRLLRSPTFFERFYPIVHGWRGVTILFLLIILLAGGGIAALYHSTLDNSFAEGIARGLQLPALRINGENILLADYRKDIQALKLFYKNQSDSSSIVAPTDDDIKQNIIDRYINTILIRQSLASFNQAVTGEEVDRQLNELIAASGSRDKLAAIVGDLYGWSIDEFVAKALIPLLEEEKLSIYISTEPTLNHEKEVLADGIYTKIVAKGNTFEKLAQEYSEDVTAELGGDLGWVERGDMIQKFEDVVFNLDLNEVSKPFQTIFGWHIAQVTDRDGDRIRVRHILIRNTTVDEYIKKLRDSADISYFISVNKATS